MNRIISLLFSNGFLCVCIDHTQCTDNNGNNDFKNSCSSNTENDKFRGFGQ